MPQTGDKVLVTTVHRGVFCGTLVWRDGDEVQLNDARCCVYWSQSTRGFLGLASVGPDAECRIGPRVPEMWLAGVTSITRCTEQAIERWGAEPWG